MKDLDLLWIEAKNRKIQQIEQEWKWFANHLKKLGTEQNILEIGCCEGGSTWFLNHFAKNLISIDVAYPPQFDPSELKESFQYVAGDSHDPRMKKVFEKFDWDFVFIDGDHSYQGVKDDFYNVLPHLKKNTLVAFHDIVISDFHHSHKCYVGEFWEELKKEYKATKFDEIKTDHEWAGIGLVWI